MRQRAKAALSLSNRPHSRKIQTWIKWTEALAWHEALAAMITGRQIREARQMLGWTGDMLLTRANITNDVLTRAEAVDGTPSITLHQAGRVQQAFEQCRDKVRKELRDGRHSVTSG